MRESEGAGSINERARRVGRGGVARAVVAASSG